MSKPSVNKPGTRRLGALKSSAIAAAVTLAVGYALAAPPANTTIGNQASATYLDTSGVSQVATSNEVVTMVQQVGAFTLNGDNTAPAAAGNTRYMPHVLTNLGNGTDSFQIKVAENTVGVAPDFTRIEIFADADGNGAADSTTPLCSSAGTPTCDTGFMQSVGGNGGTFKFVVAYQVPSTATTASWPSNAATVTAEVPVTSPIYASYGSNVTETDVDTITLTTNAAFSVNKSIQQPSVAAPGGGAWPAVASSGPASSSATCPTVWSPGLTTNATCTYTMYTLGYKNNGGAAGVLAVNDPLPSGMTYVSGSAVWSSANGIALGDATGSGDDQPGITYEYDAANRRILASIANVGANVSGSLSFVVLVNETAAVDTSTTTNVARYSGESCATDPLTCTTEETNDSPFDVTATYGVVAANVTSTTPDDVEDNPTVAGENVVEQPSVAAGASVSFPVVVTNTGNDTDTFNVVVDLSSSTFPTGTTFTLFRQDNTLLPNTTVEGIPDTGPLAAGANYTFIVKAQVPASATVGTGPHLVRVTATSATATISTDRTDDSVWLRVQPVTGSLVDLTNTAAGTGAGGAGNGDLGPGPSPQPTTTNITQAGTGTTFPLFIRNNDTGFDNTFDLAASQTPTFPGTLPTGWVVAFHAAGGVCGDPAITNVSVTAGTQQQVVACVTPPVDAALSTQNIYFRAQSTGTTSTGVAIRDIKMDAVTVLARDVAAVVLDPDNSGQVSAGGAVTYAHTLRNSGNQTCGAFTVDAALSAADVTAGWTRTLYEDVNGNGQIDAGDTLVSGPVPLAPATFEPSEEMKVLVRVFAPGGATAGTTSVVTVTATDTTGVCPTDSAIDTSTVVTGQIRLYKQQIADLNCDASEEPASEAPLVLAPNQCIVYKVIAVNEGDAPVNNVTVSDSIPVYTLYNTPSQPASQCSSTGLTGTAVTFSTVGAPVVSVNCGSTTNTLDPGGQIVLRFAVRIDPL